MSIEQQPNKGLRFALAFAIGATGVGGVILTARTLSQEASKAPVVAAGPEPTETPLTAAPQLLRTITPDDPDYKAMASVTATPVRPSATPTQPEATATSVPDTATAKPADTATATSTATNTATATATVAIKPEVPKFVSNGIYTGAIEGGGTAIIGMLPNDTVIFASVRTTTCSSPNYYDLMFRTSGTIKAGNASFEIKQSGSVQIKGTLLDNKTIAVQILDKGRTFGSPEGQITCSAQNLNFKAELIGRGKSDLIQAYIEAFAATGKFGKLTEANAIAQLESACKCKLPE